MQQVFGDGESRVVPIGWRDDFGFLFLAYWNDIYDYNDFNKRSRENSLTRYWWIRLM